MKGKKKKKRRHPDPPPDPHNYILVRTREGAYWRRKRGTVKEAPVNTVLQANVDHLQFASAAAKRLKSILNPFIARLDTGRFIAKISALIKKTYQETGKINFSQFKGYDIQPHREFSNIMPTPPFVNCANGEVIMEIDNAFIIVDKKNQLVDGYFFDAVLVYGDPTIDNGLRIESDTSPLYSFSKRSKSKCRLTLILPTSPVPWMALFKVSCMEEGKPAHNPRHYGMKVMMVGEGGVASLRSQ